MTTVASCAPVRAGPSNSGRSDIAPRTTRAAETTNHSRSTQDACTSADVLSVTLAKGDAATSWESALITEVNRVRLSPSTYAHEFVERAVVGAPYVIPYERSQDVENVVHEISTAEQKLLQAQLAAASQRSPQRTVSSVARNNANRAGGSAASGRYTPSGRRKSRARGSTSVTAKISDFPPQQQKDGAGELDAAATASSIALAVSATKGTRSTIPRILTEALLVDQSSDPLMAPDSEVPLPAESLDEPTEWSLLKQRDLELTVAQLLCRVRFLDLKRERISRAQETCQALCDAEILQLRTQWSQEDAEKAKKKRKTTTTPNSKRSTSNPANATVQNGSGTQGDSAMPGSSVSDSYDALRGSEVQAIERKYVEKLALLANAAKEIATCADAAKDGVALMLSCTKQLRSVAPTPPLLLNRGLTLAAHALQSRSDEMHSDRSATKTTATVVREGRRLSQEAPPEVLRACCSQFGISSGPLLTMLSVNSSRPSPQQVVMQLLLGSLMTPAQPTYSLYNANRNGKSHYGSVDNSRKSPSRRKTPSLSILQREARMVGCYWASQPQNTASTTMVLSSCFEELSIVSARFDAPLASMVRMLSVATDRDRRRCNVHLNSCFQVAPLSPATHPVYLKRDSNPHIVVRLAAPAASVRIAASLEPWDALHAVSVHPPESRRETAPSQGAGAAHSVPKNTFLHTLSDLASFPLVPVDSPGQLLVQRSAQSNDVVEVHVSLPLESLPMSRVEGSGSVRKRGDNVEEPAGFFYELQLFERPVAELLSEYSYIGRVLFCVGDDGSDGGARDVRAVVPKNLPTPTVEFGERCATLISPFCGTLSSGTPQKFHIVLPIPSTLKAAAFGAARSHWAKEMQRLEELAKSSFTYDGRPLKEILSTLQTELSALLLSKTANESRGLDKKNTRGSKRFGNRINSQQRKGLLLDGAGGTSTGLHRKRSTRPSVALSPRQSPKHSTGDESPKHADSTATLSHQPSLTDLTEGSVSPFLSSACSPSAAPDVMQGFDSEEQALAAISERYNVELAKTQQLYDLIVSGGQNSLGLSMSGGADGSLSPASESAARRRSRKFSVFHPGASSSVTITEHNSGEMKANESLRADSSAIVSVSRVDSEEERLRIQGVIHSMQGNVALIKNIYFALEERQKRIHEEWKRCDSALRAAEELYGSCSETQNLAESAHKEQANTTNNTVVSLHFTRSNSRGLLPAASALNLPPLFGPKAPRLKGEAVPVAAAAAAHTAVSPSRSINHETFACGEITLRRVPSNDASQMEFEADVLLPSTQSGNVVMRINDLPCMQWRIM